jgi:glycosyltransferase involved in cell wall biosynthesis
MTDGVSLEIAKRRQILELNGFSTAAMAGPGSSGADYLVPSLDFNSPIARRIADNAFGDLKDYSDAAGLMRDIETLSDTVEKEIEEVLRRYRPGFIFLHNVFSHGRHIASAGAFRKVLERYEIPVLATHHDFYWERVQYRYPSCSAVEKYLEENIPPLIPGVRHAVINSLAAGELKRRTGIEAMVFPDTLDFRQKKWTADSWTADIAEDSGFRAEDIVVLQATRIVRRKGIELMIPVLRSLNSDTYLGKLRGKTLYNGKRITVRSRFFYLIAGYAEEDAGEYLKSLEILLEKEEIPHSFIGDRVAAQRSESGESRIYSLFDLYPRADIISYPSLYEGWGNQFLEAVFAEKPVMVFEYPVFKSDIKGKGYSFISLGDRVETDKENNLFLLPEDKVGNICHQVIETLINPDTSSLLKKNYLIGSEHNSYAVLEELLSEGMKVS